MARSGKGRYVQLCIALLLALALPCLFGCSSSSKPSRGESVYADGTGASEERGTAVVVEEPPVAIVPDSPSGFKGEHVEDVCYLLVKAGFTNIEPREDADLRVALMHDEGDVSKVTIEGSSSFSKNEEFPTDARIVVEYHTFRKQSKRTFSKDELKATIAGWLQE